MTPRRAGPEPGRHPAATTDAAPPSPAAPRARRPDLRAAGNLAVQRLYRDGLRVGSPQDAAEREAHAVARHVAAGGSVQVARMCGCAHDVEEEDRTGAAPPEVLRTLATPGTALPLSVRRDMEHSFGRDFGAVRLHSGADAARSATAVEARAYTVGPDVVLGSGVPPLTSPEGRRVLAHELTHVVQQGASSDIVRGDFLDSASDLLSGAADAVTGVVSDVVTGVGEAVSDLGQRAADALPNLASIVGFSAPTAATPAAFRTILDAAAHPVVITLAGSALPPGAVPMARGALQVLEIAADVMANPDPYVEQLRAGLEEQMQQAGPTAQRVAAAALPAGAAALDAADCVARHLEPKLEYVWANWWDVLKGMAWDMIWPWPGVAADLSSAWDHVLSAGARLWRLDFSGFTDDVLAVLRYVNAAVGRLYLWFFLASVLVGAIGGGIAGTGAAGAGAVPGALAGAASGAGFAGTVGLGLLVATLAIEGASIAKAAWNLTSPDRTPDQRECDCEVIASSSLTVGITTAMALLGGLAARLGKGLVQAVFNRAWRRPALRGRGTRSRGDVLADRFALSELTKARLNQRRVAVTDALSPAENFRGLDLTIDANIQVTSQATGSVLTSRAAIRGAFNAGEKLRIDVSGGNLVQVKSHGPIKSMTSTITREINAVGNFTQGKFSGHTVVVTNPGTRTLVVFLREALSAADEATVRAAAAQRGVVLELIVGGAPSGHPAVVAIDAIPAVFAEIGREAADEVTEGAGSPAPCP